MKKYMLPLFMLVMFAVNIAHADERHIVKVGGYHFPPFVVDEHGVGTGLSLDLLDLMNTYQETYRFEFVLTSSKRRFEHFNKGKYDMIMFESIDWGWKGRDVDATDVYLVGGSKYITKAEPGKDQRYFDDFEGKSILLILGYHYGFCNYNTDPEYLREHYNATMTSTHEGNILSVIKGRADITVVINAFSQKYLHEHPELKAQLLVSDKYDLKNYYTTLIRKNTTPGVEEMKELFARMKHDGVFAKFWARYGIEAQ